MTSTETGITGTYYIDALLENINYRWNSGSAVGTPTAITYSFMTSAPSNADSEDSNGFSVFSEAQMAATRLAVASIASMTGLTFTETDDSGDVNIRLANNNQNGVSSGYAYLPNSMSDGRGGQVYIASDTSSSAELNVGDFGYSTLLHEIGHALGLKHPGNYNAGDSSESAGTPPFLPSDEDNTGNSLMSYTDHVSGLSAATLMPYDIAALQYLYGANTVTGAGASVYNFTDQALLQTVYDAGGVDTFSFASLSRGVTVNLAAGAHSSVGTRTDGSAATLNLAIALDTVIENATGSNYADSIQGNGSDNTLTGGSDNDTLAGLDGMDVLFGGLGRDVIYGGLGNDTIYGGQDEDDIYGGQGDDRVESGMGADTIASGIGRDTIYAGQGGDLIYAGQGDDWISTGLGNDTILAGLGNDTLIGGGDGDWFMLAASAGDDRIEDFSLSAGDRLGIGTGVAYTVADTTNGTLIQFSAGGSALIFGVASADALSGIVSV